MCINIDNVQKLRPLEKYKNYSLVDRSKKEIKPWTLFKEQGATSVGDFMSAEIWGDQRVRIGLRFKTLKQDAATAIIFRT